MTVSCNEYGGLLCDHESVGDKRLVRRSVQGGQTWYVLQCQTCGRQLKNYGKRGVGQAMLEWRVEGPLCEWDEAIGERWAARLHAHYDARRAEADALRADRDAEWWARYEAHLSSAKWQEIRRKVLARAAGKCEGCGALWPSHCHHLSYEHAGHEFLFELVALCEACHQRLHPVRDLGR